MGDLCLGLARVSGMCLICPTLILFLLHGHHHHCLPYFHYLHGHHHQIQHHRWRCAVPNRRSTSWSSLSTRTNQSRKIKIWNFKVWNFETLWTLWGRAGDEVGGERGGGGGGRHFARGNCWRKGKMCFLQNLDADDGCPRLFLSKMCVHYIFINAAHTHSPQCT